MLQERGRGAVLVGVAKVDAALEHLIQAVRAPAPNGCCASGWIARLEALIAMPIVSLPAKGAIDQIVGTYPIGTFRLLKTNDLRQFGECLTQRQVLGGVGSVVWGLRVMEFEFLIPDRPVSVQARRRQRKQEWQQFVAEEAAKTWGRSPIADKHLQCTLIYLCGDAPVYIDNIVKPILDTLKGLVYEDDILIADVEARRRPLASPTDYNREQWPDHLLQGLLSSSECVYVGISEQPILEEKL